ncbi:MAG: DUF6457 domain-containing protein [Candidatus Nanopelagicales bacterium]
MDAVDSFSEILASELGVAMETSTGELLDLAKDVAHQVARPATPVATYIMGLAAASGNDSQTIAAAVGRSIELWKSQQSD